MPAPGHALTRPATTEGDPDAEQRLNADLGGGDLPDARTPMFHHIAARTRFFDAVTLAAVESGTTQVVIVGAGYDGRALRFRRPGVRYFELDLPATQLDKRERLARLAIPVDDVTFVPIDLADADVDGTLGAAGHDATRISLFICEGLLVYLDLPVVERLFVSLRRPRRGRWDPVAVNVSGRDRRGRRSGQLGAPCLAAAPVGGVERAVAHQPERLRVELAPRGVRLNPAAAVDPHDLDPDAPAGGALLITATAGTGSEPAGPRRVAARHH